MNNDVTATIAVTILLVFGMAIFTFSIGWIMKSILGMFEQNRSILMEQAKSSIGFLVNRGVDVVLNGKHLYKSGDGYTILIFDKDANIRRDSEEKFSKNEGTRAIERFIELTGGALVDDDIEIGED